MMKNNLDGTSLKEVDELLKYNNEDYTQRDLVKRGKGVSFERVRRITGYLVGTLDRFGDGKRSEEADRIKHF